MPGTLLNILYTLFQSLHQAYELNASAMKS